MINWITSLNQYCAHVGFSPPSKGLHFPWKVSSSAQRLVMPQQPVEHVSLSTARGTISPLCKVKKLFSKKPPLLLLEQPDQANSPGRKKLCTLLLNLLCNSPMITVFHPNDYSVKIFQAYLSSSVHPTFFCANDLIIKKLKGKINIPTLISVSILQLRNIH